MSHDDSGHLGFDKTYDLVSSQYWFKGMRLFVRKYVNNCLNCLYFKLPGGKRPGSLHPIPKTPVPFHTVHIDHLGPFVKTKEGNTQLFLIIDAFTKFILLYPVKSTKSKLAIKCLQDMIKVFGVPRRIICDHGRSFTSEKFREFCDHIQTKIHFNAVATPRGNGQVERYNRTVLDSLANMGADLDDDCWDENLHNVQLGLNGTLNRAVGVSPSEALMGFRVVSGGLLEPEDRTPLDVTEIRARMVAHTELYQASQKNRFDHPHSTPRLYQEGDLVLIRISSTPATGSSQKLLPKWRGPFQVAKVLGNDRYEVKDIPGTGRSMLRYSGVAAVDRPQVSCAQRQSLSQTSRRSGIIER
jgi:transposase InsO family protein